MKMADKVVFVGLACLFFVSSSFGDQQCKEIGPDFLPANLEIQQPNNEFVAFCFIGIKNNSLHHSWGSIQVTLHHNPERNNVKLLKADSCASLNKIHNQTILSQLRSWLLDTDSLKHKVLQLNPFKTSCIGLQTNKKVSISVEFKWVHWQFPLAFLGGLLLFYSADKLSRNALFFYSSGVAVGWLACLLILVFILYRLIPHKTGAIAVLIGGWSGVLFLLQYTMNSFYDLLMSNNQIVISYLLVAGVISFAVCYYYGPVASDRGRDLIRWTLQLGGLSLLYMGTQSEEVSVAVVFLVLIVHVLRNTGISMFRVFPNRWIPYRLIYLFDRPKFEFLTEEEYATQGAKETQRALQELREYCSSPECDTWRLVNRLQRPAKFANFMYEGEHFTEDEIRRYEEDSRLLSFLTDDEGGSDDDTDEGSS